MIAKLLSLWQKIIKHRVAIGVVGIVLVVVMALIIVGYWFDWTGFNEYNKVTIAHTISGTNAGTVTKTEEYQPGKSLWDWLQLLFIPAVLTLGAVWITARQNHDREIAEEQRKTDRELAEQQHKAEYDLAVDNQRATQLQEYFDRMTDLLLNKDLRTTSNSEVLNLARMRTITILFQLDARRIGYVFAFLRGARLMNHILNVSNFSLYGADLKEINLSQATLFQADLSGADLRRADLHKAELYQANLSKANLFRADLSGADLFEANLNEANLTEAFIIEANLVQAKLSGATLVFAKLTGAVLRKANLRYTELRRASLNKADLNGADLSGADLSGANLVRANLVRADLSDADLSDADLGEADLSYANLTGVKVTDEQLGETKSLQGATMPDGSKHYW